MNAARGPHQQAAEAFRHLRDGKHFGKIVIDLA
jgi:hypothetical protein